MAHQIDYRIVGDDMQAVMVALDPEETVQLESGSMMFMESGIEMNSELQGGLMAGLKRKIGGESLFITTYTNTGTERRFVSFAAPYPGKIIPLDLAAMGPVFCQRDAYLASAYGIEITIAFTKRLGAGFFGGEGFILQKLDGDGLAFIQAGGTILKHELKPSQTLEVDTGCLVGFQESVDYDIRMVGNVKTALFGGEGLFLAHLTGPGIAYLQTLPFSRMANRIISAAGLWGTRGEVRRGGGMLGKMLNGD